MIAYISGASRGLGKALTEKLLEDGHVVFAGTREKECDELNILKASFSNTLFMCKTDVVDESSVNEAADIIQKECGKLDVIINCAAILYGERKGEDKVTGIDFGQLIASVDVNVYGSMRVIKYMLPLLHNSPNPMIINITSEAGSMKDALFCFDPYNISKTFINVITHKLNRIMNQKAVKVLAIHPGRMKTDMSGGKGDITPQQSALGIAHILYGNTAVPGDVWFIDYLGVPMAM